MPDIHYVIFSRRGSARGGQLKPINQVFSACFGKTTQLHIKSQFQELITEKVYSYFFLFLFAVYKKTKGKI